MKTLPFPTDNQRDMSGVGGRGGSDDGDTRLRNVELDVREIKTDMKHVATRNDVSGLKLWVLGGVIGGITTAIFIVLGLARFIMNASTP